MVLDDGTNTLIGVVNWQLSSCNVNLAQKYPDFYLRISYEDVYDWIVAEINKGPCDPEDEDEESQ